MRRRSSTHLPSRPQEKDAVRDPGKLQGDRRYWVPVPIQYPAASCRGVSLDVVSYSKRLIRIGEKRTRLTVRPRPTSHFANTERRIRRYRMFCSLRERLGNSQGTRLTYHPGGVGRWLMSDFARKSSRSASSSYHAKTTSNGWTPAKGCGGRNLLVAPTRIMSARRPGPEKPTQRQRSFLRISIASARAPSTKATITSMKARALSQPCQDTGVPGLGSALNIDASQATPPRKMNAPPTSGRGTTDFQRPTVRAISDNPSWPKLRICSQPTVPRARMLRSGRLP